MINKIGILGYGEVGQAIHKFYDETETEVYIADKRNNKLIKGLAILHVCIPYSNSFLKTILRMDSKYSPEFIVIHSTVKVGTTKYLNERLQRRVVHSPVMGIHPNLYEGIKTFKKFIGYESMDTAYNVQKHFDSLGITSEIVLDSRNTELGKLLDTTYYGLCISYHGYIADLCTKNGLDFNTVATDFNNTYNEGYAKLGMPYVNRPVLRAPEHHIGGHCIIPNAKILMKQFGINNILKSILKYK
jgi:UDP-glucose 6-dehydrogenase